MRLSEGSCVLWLMSRDADLLTAWNRVLLEKLTGFHLVKKFPVFCGTGRFITTRANIGKWMYSRLSMVIM